MTDTQTDLAVLLSTLSPEERLRLEDLAVASILDEEHRRRREANPEGYRVVDEHAEACVKAILGDPPMPLSPEAEAALRVALAQCAQGILAERDREDASA